MRRGPLGRYESLIEAFRWDYAEKQGHGEFALTAEPAIVESERASREKITWKRKKEGGEKLERKGTCH